MAIASETVELQFNDIVADVAIPCNVKCFDVSHVKVYYGTTRVLATLTTHYTVTLNGPTFANFEITPTAALLAAIAALDVPTNVIHVRRQVPFTSDFEDTDGFLRERIAKQFDLAIMMMQQINHDFGLIVDLADAANQAAAAADAAVAAASAAASAAADLATAVTAAEDAAAAAQALVDGAVAAVEAAEAAALAAIAAATDFATEAYVNDAVSALSDAVDTALSGKQATSEKGAANGYASLDGDGKVPEAQIPVPDGTEAALTSTSNSIAWDMSAAWHFKVDTLGENSTLANPTGVTAGKSGRIRVIQDGTGSRTLNYGSNYIFLGGQKPILSTAVGAVDVLGYDAISATQILVWLLRDAKGA